MQFEFSKKEIDLIKEASIREKVDLSQVEIIQNPQDTNIYILQSDDEDLLNDIREACGELLVTIGFTKDDEPTEDGKVLEGLMDKLFIS